MPQIHEIKLQCNNISQDNQQSHNESTETRISQKPVYKINQKIHTHSAKKLAETQEANPKNKDTKDNPPLVLSTPDTPWYKNIKDCLLEHWNIIEDMINV